MIEAKIGTIYEEERQHLDGTIKLTPMVPVYFTDGTGEVIASATYKLRKGSAVEGMDDVIARVKAEIERLDKTDIVSTRTDPLTGETIDILERDTLSVGDGVEATPNKNYQVTVADISKFEDSLITKDTEVSDLTTDVKGLK